MLNPWTRRRLLAAGAGALALPLVGRATAVAGNFPSRPIKLLTSGAAGSVPDAVGRILGEYLSRALGQPLVIEGRTGPGGIAAIQALQASEPDGHTLALATISQVVFNAYLFKSLPYEPTVDLVPISKLASAAMVIAAPASSKARTVSDLSAMGMREELLIGSPPYGTPPHLVALKFLKAAGIKGRFVPFKSGPDAVVAAMRGDIHLVVDGPTILAPQVQEGSLLALVVTGHERSKLLPGTPTVAEAGVPMAEAETWFGLVAPKGTPTEVINQIALAIRTALDAGELATKLTAMGLVPIRSTSSEFAVAIRQDHDQWKAVIRDAGLAPT